MNIEIYKYTKPSSYLQDIWEAKREKNPSFTIRAWAKQLGLKSHNPLYEVIRGKRKLPKNYIPQLIETLKLDPQESLYLEAMIDLEKAKKIEEKELYIARLQEMAPRSQIMMVEVENFRMLEDPLHMIIRNYSA